MFLAVVCMMGCSCVRCAGRGSYVVTFRPFLNIILVLAFSFGPLVSKYQKCLAQGRIEWYTMAKNTKDFYSYFLLN